MAWLDDLLSAYQSLFPAGAAMPQQSAAPTTPAPDWTDRIMQQRQPIPANPQGAGDFPNAQQEGMHSRDLLQGSNPAEVLPDPTWTLPSQGWMYGASFNPNDAAMALGVPKPTIAPQGMLDALGGVQLGTPVDQMPLGYPEGSGFTSDILPRVRPVQPDIDPNMSSTPTSPGFPLGDVYSGTLPSYRPRDI